MIRRSVDSKREPLTVIVVPPATGPKPGVYAGFENVGGALYSKRNGSSIVRP
jgi:hypothetical protein